ncbi:MAG TPA: XRE family transcriptional regulator [Aliiroseovarius sp.]|nr:XRE family transcriptional regulator [Aliiroseovarius sp.]
MTNFNRFWIKEHLTGKRGEQAALARAMGINADKMSKIMRGERQIKADELPGMLKFFGVSLRDGDSQPASGFSESEATPFTPKQGDATNHLLAAFLATRRAPEIFEAKTHALGFAILAGDLLAVEMTGTAAMNDLVLCTLADPQTGAANTLLRRYAPPWALSGALPPDAAIRTNTADGSFAILGVVRAVLRRA